MSEMKLPAKLWLGLLLLMTVAMAGASLARIAGLIGPDGVSWLFGVQAMLFAVGSLLGVALTVAVIWRMAGRPELMALVYFLAYWDLTNAGFGFGVADPGFQLLSTTTRPDSILAGLIGMCVIGLQMSWYLRFCGIFPTPLRQDSFAPDTVSPVKRPIRVLQRWFLDPKHTRILVWVWLLFGMIVPPVLTMLASEGLVPSPLSGSLSFLMYWFLPAAVFALGASYLRAGYLTSSLAHQKQILWLVNAFMIASGLFILQLILYPFDMMLGMSRAHDVGLLCLAIIPLVVNACLALSVFYGGAVDPRLVIRRSTVYGALGILFVFLVAGLGNIASEFFETRLGLPGLIGAGIYGGTVAVLLLPLRGRFEKVAERWMPKLEPETEYQRAESAREADTSPYEEPPGFTRS